MARSFTLSTVFAAVLSAVGLPAAAQSFTLWVTETPAGGTAQYNAQLNGGVRSYVFNGLSYAAGPTIAAAELDDPSAVVFEAGGSLFVSNRGFNSGPGSVSIVGFGGATPGTPAVQLANIDTGPHQAAVTPAGGLVVSSLTSGGKLYAGAATYSGVSYASGAQRGAAVDGNVLYSTSGTGSLQTFAVDSGASTATFGVSGASLLHYATLWGGALWLADIGSHVTGAGGGVYKVTLDGSTGMPTASAKVANVDGAISVAFSPDGSEMFVASHFGGTITGFAVTGGNVAATSNLSIDGGTLASWNGAHVQFGGMAVSPVPEPAAWALMLGGVAMLGALRRRPRA